VKPIQSPTLPLFYPPIVLALVCVALLTFIGASSTALAESIDLSEEGLEGPESTITFDEVDIADTAEVTNEFAGFGVTFEPNLFLRVGDHPDWQNIEGPNLRTGDPEVNPFSIKFGNALTSAAFVAIAQPPTPTTITAKRNGVEVESFETTVSIDNPDNYFGFEDITFDEIEVEYTAATRMRIDNLQLGEAAASGIDPDSVIAAYTFDDGTAKDVSGNGNDGTIDGAEPTADVPDGNKSTSGALEFDGASAIDTPDLGETQNLTIATWFKVTGRVGDWRVFYNVSGWSSGWVHHQIHPNNRVEFSIHSNPGGNDQFGETLFDDAEVDTWHHSAVVYNGEDGSIQFYIDGELDGEADWGGNEVLLGEGQIGAWDGGRQFEGVLDEFFILNAALTAEEVGDLMANSLGNPGIEVVHGKEEILDEGGPDGWDLTVFVVDPLITSDDTEANGIPDGTVTSWTAAFREDRADGEHKVAPVLAKRDTDSGDITVVGVGDLVAPEQGEESITLPWGVGTGSNMIDLTEQNTEWLMGLYQGGPNGNNAGAVVPFAGGGNYPMFAWDTADVPPEPDELVSAGHASHDAPAAREYQFNFTVTWGGGGSNDRDGDGLPNFYEEANGLNPDDPTDAASDGDNDGLTALQEFERRTDLTKADTDGDGLGDKVETGTGVWVSAEDTGTDARKADTDKDGLPDGVETNTGVFVSKTDAGTDPHNANTDGDDFGDSTEVNVCESNPVDANDGCDELGLLAFWDFNDPSNPDEAVDLVSDIVADLDAAYTDDGGGRTGEGGDYALNHLDGGTAHVPNADFLNLAGAVDLMTVSMWQKNTGTRNASSYWMLADGFDRANQAHIPWSNNLIYFDTSGGCCAANSQRLQFDPAGQEGLEDFDFLDELWHHYAFVKNGETKEVWVDGILAFETPDADPLPEDGWTDLFIGSAANGGNPADGCVDDFAVYALALTEEAIVALANGESPIGGTKIVFQILSMVRGETELELTWSSKNGKEYSVEYIRPLAGEGWIELDDGVASEGEQTSFTDDDAARLAEPDGWYRIREN
jgi:hypothetical protein